MDFVFEGSAFVTVPSEEHGPFVLTSIAWLYISGFATAKTLYQMASAKMDVHFCSMVPGVGEVIHEGGIFTSVVDTGGVLP